MQYKNLSIITKFCEIYNRKLSWRILWLLYGFEYCRCRLLGRHLFLVHWDTITQNLKMSQRIVPFLATISSITLDGVHSAILNSFHDANMVSAAVQSAAFFVIPVEEDNHAGSRSDVAARPLIVLLEPVDTPFTSGEFGNDTGLNIAALVGTPTHKAGTPIHTFGNFFEKWDWVYLGFIAIKILTITRNYPIFLKKYVLLFYPVLSYSRTLFLLAKVCQFLITRRS